MTDSPATAVRRAEKLGSLEIGRFIAASFVVFDHFIPFVQSFGAAPGRVLFGGFSTPGPLGVEYFFVLSGFVMVNAHLDDFGKLSSVWNFWWRRACRIYPVYWLALCVPAYFLWRSLNWPTALHVFLLDPWGSIDFIPPAWTLRYEMAFYIALGLCMLPYAGRPLLVLWVGLSIWCHLPPDVLALVHLGPPFFPNHVFGAIGLKFGSVFNYFFFGGLAAGWVFTRRRLGVGLSWALLGFGAALLLYLLPASHYGTDYGPTALFTVPSALSLTCIILGLAGLERHGVLRLGKAAWLGTISYPLYLLHVPLMLLASHTLPALHLQPAGQYVFAAVALAALYAATAAITFAFDQPVQRVLRRATRARRQAALGLNLTG